MVVKVVDRNKLIVQAMSTPMIIFLNCDDRRQQPKIDSVEFMTRTDETDRRAIQYLKRLQCKSQYANKHIYSQLVFNHASEYKAGDLVLHSKLNVKDSLSFFDPDQVKINALESQTFILNFHQRPIKDRSLPKKKSFSNDDFDPRKHNIKIWLDTKQNCMFL